MLRTGLEMARGRWSGFAGAFVTLCLGVALISMTALVHVSASPRVPDRYAGAGVLVRTPVVEQVEGFFLEDRPWSPETVAELTGRLSAIPGVTAAVPDRSFYAQAVVGGRPVPADLRGYGWASTALAPYEPVAGRAPQRPGEVVLDRELGLPPGSPVTLLTAAGPAPYTVTGALDAPGFHVTDAEAARLSGGVRVIGLVTETGADLGQVERAAREVVGGRGEVLSGDARSALEPRTDERVRWIGTQVLTGMTVLAGFASIFVVASTFAFGVVQRRREFGLLRLVGATPRQVRRMVYGEALAVGSVAAVAGVALGTALAPLLGDLLVEAGFEPPGFSVRIEAWPLAASFAAGLVVALLAVWSASRRAGRARPLEALREASVERRTMTPSRWVAGAAFAATGIACAVATAGAEPGAAVNLTLYAAMALIVGLTLLAPAIIPPVVRAVAWPLSRTRGATGVLVRQGMLAAVRRTAATTAPVLVTVGFATLVTGMTQTTAAAVATDRTTAVRADAVVLPEGTPGLSDAAVAAADGIALLPTTVYAEGLPPLEASGITSEALARAADRLRVVEGALEAAGKAGDGDRPVETTGEDGGLETAGKDDGRHPAQTAGADDGGNHGAASDGGNEGGNHGAASEGGVIVARWLADERGWRTGTRLPLTFEDGRSETLPVTAVVADAPTPLLLPRDTVRSHDPSALTPEILVDGAVRDEVIGGRVLDPGAYARQARTEDDRLVWIFTLILAGMAVGYTGLSIANTMVMSTVDRASDFRVLRMSGATPRQVLGTVTAESVIVAGLGAALGVAVALPALLGMGSALTAQVGAPVELVIPWPVVLAVVGGCLVLAVSAAVIPTLAAVRRTR
ncbi:FtsX-like permease family protein [Planobispora takensis]|uniref:ABC transporter permease n=1 Tax=Planobispora takensis TaxID=1367882 RepID=A0A8J3T5M0_9ACTN|nr:ABC transporter permease [Planobispora takensis]GII04575.1 ABC transporter permease [Planobispora takensis]